MGSIDEEAAAVEVETTQNVIMVMARAIMAVVMVNDQADLKGALILLSPILRVKK